MNTKETIKKYRVEHNYSQAEMAVKLGITREMLNKIEGGKSNVSRAVNFSFNELIKSEIDLLKSNELLENEKNNANKGDVNSNDKVNKISTEATDSVIMFTNSGNDTPLNEGESSIVNEEAEAYIKIRQKKKLEQLDEGIIYVPVAAQAGYSKRMSDPKFESDFERVYLPGLKFKGAKYRIFEVDGDSMTATLKDGNQVIAELVEQEGYESIANYYIYVIVTDDMITIKRVFRKSPDKWVLISDNDEFYDQFLFDVKNIKELWKVKRKIDWEMAPPKKFDIKL